MESFTRSHLKELIDYPKHPLISVYIPTDPKGTEARQAPIRLKNQLRAAQENLERFWPQARRDLAEHLDRALALTRDTLFWEYQDLGFALFVGPDFFLYFRLALPIREESYVGRFFHIKPLLPLLTSKPRYYLLAVSLHEVRLYAVHDDQIFEQPLSDVPTSIEVLRQYEEAEKQIQLHTTPMGKSPGGSAVFHGQGSAADEKEHKKRIAEFVRQVVRGIERHLEADSTPVIAAAEPYVLHLIGECHPRFHLADESVSINPHHLSAEQLLEKSRNRMSGRAEQHARTLPEHYHALAKADRVIRQADQIVPMSSEGRVDTLFVDIERPVWGYWDKSGGLIQIHQQRMASDEDLSDLAVLNTLRHSGQVQAMPRQALRDESPMVAILRY